jgi:hypothetical protein
MRNASRPARRYGDSSTAIMRNRSTLTAIADDDPAAARGSLFDR